MTTSRGTSGTSGSSGSGRTRRPAKTASGRAAAPPTVDLPPDAVAHAADAADLPVEITEEPIYRETVRDLGVPGLPADERRSAPLSGQRHGATAIGA